MELGKGAGGIKKPPTWFFKDTLFEKERRVSSEQNANDSMNGGGEGTQSKETWMGTMATPKQEIRERKLPGTKAKTKSRTKLAFGGGKKEGGRRLRRLL